MTDTKDLPVRITGGVAIGESPYLEQCPQCREGVLYVNDPLGHKRDCLLHHYPKKYLPEQHNRHVIAYWMAQTEEL
jgi:hypothetical protein